MLMDSSSPSDRGFFSQIFHQLVERHAHQELIEILDLKQEAELSYLCDRSGVQHSFCLRAVHRARQMAHFILDENGEINFKALNTLLDLLEKTRYIPYPQGYGDARLMHRLISLLKRLRKDAHLVRQLKRFHAPVCHHGAEELIRDTLLLPPSASLGDVEVRQAVLISCFAPLRQNVGSCFATAPAILIHEEQIASYLDDLYEMLTTGRLKRVIAGEELVVPLSMSSGAGDLKKSIHSFNSRTELWCSPGLIAALESVGLLSGTIPVKIEKLKSLLLPLLQSKKGMNIEECLEHLLLASTDISSEELRERSALDRMHKGELRLGVASYSRKREAVSAFYVQLHRAKAVFRAQADVALLKAWEFTVASFCDVKTDFSRWNLYRSLGLEHREPGGIGEQIYKILNESLSTYNQEIAIATRDYEIAFDQTSAVEALLRRASSETQARRLQAEHQAKAYHMRACLEKRTALIERGEALAALLSFLIKEYTKKFSLYFQEIYDPDLQDVQCTQYADSPAGFRLVYKQGRNDPVFWTRIFNAEQYVDCLANFFLKTEHEIAAECKTAVEREEIGKITSSIIIHLRTQEFLESAIRRMIKTHEHQEIKKPLENLHRIEKKPWAYTSGGTMKTLLMSYFRREGAVFEEAKCVESGIELGVFLIDTIKHLSAHLTNPFLEDLEKGMLIQSPTHAFVLHPGWEVFKRGWQEEIFTYTWVRDTLLLPAKKFYEGILLSFSEQRFLIDLLTSELAAERVYLPERLLAPLQHLAYIQEFKQSCLEEIGALFALKDESFKQNLSDRIDALLYRVLPLLEKKEWKTQVRALLASHYDVKVEQVLEQYAFDSPYLTAQQIQEVAKACYLMAHQNVALSFDLHAEVASRARFLGLAAPEPFLFADTNWADHFFALIVSPASRRLELWRVDCLGLEGWPMSSWNPYFEERNTIPWMILPRTFEYMSASSGSAR